MLYWKALLKRAGSFQGSLKKKHDCTLIGVCLQLCAQLKKKSNIDCNNKKFETNVVERKELATDYSLLRSLLHNVILQTIK